MGLLLDEKLSLTKHIHEKWKLHKRLLVLSNYLPLRILSQMYKTLVPHRFDYCDVIYHLPPLDTTFNLYRTLNHLMDRIEKLQYQAELAITGAWQCSNRMRLYKLQSNMSPQYLKIIFLVYEDPCIWEYLPRHFLKNY